MGGADRGELQGLRDEVKGKLSFLDVLALEGIAVRRSGPNWVACCPFHQERTPSFTVHGSRLYAGHCYGCGWHGDVIDFWRERRGGGFLEALRALASLASIPVDLREWRQAAQVPQVTEVAAGMREKPALPRLRALREDEVAHLAELRGLSVPGVAAAAAAKRVAFARWPQWQGRDGAWREGSESAGAWVVTDSARWVAQFRRLDGAAYRIKRDGGEWGEIKAWTKGSPAWPLGAGEMGERGAVVMVEGGADMLAAFHFLEGWGRLNEVAVVAMLGASNRIAGEALPLFERKRVRIFMDADEPKGDRGIRPGAEAAARWGEQLVEAGAAVEVFSLDGLTRRDGSRVKDLNDLALADDAVWAAGELREAFFDFDF